MQLNWCFTSDDEFIGRMTWDITGDTKSQIRGIFVGLMSAKSLRPGRRHARKQTSILWRWLDPPDGQPGG
jgi:hypothetical protein